jgi:hypothetical protein
VEVADLTDAQREHHGLNGRQLRIAGNGVVGGRDVFEFR